jgi:class 3 adenylate cyclase/tetratricopeptide (TPR) repeat protein
MEAERRQVTVVFVDMVGSTAFAEKSGEEATFALVRTLSTFMSDAVRSHGGVVQGFRGDGIMALFGAPLGGEDPALQACRAALSILKQLAANANALEDKYGVRPQLRIGVNTGAAVVGAVSLGSETEVSAFGDTVNVASHLQARALPGTVYISEATHRLVLGMVETTPAGRCQIKGKVEPQTLYQLDAVREGVARFDAALSRGLTSFFGRERELAVLKSAVAAARFEHIAVDIVAEAGLGKSRLLHEFRLRQRSDEVIVISGSCLPESRQSAFRPLLEVLRRAFDIKPGESEREIVPRLDRGLKAIGLHSALNIALLVHILGLAACDESLEALDGVLLGLRTRELLAQLLEALCRVSPVVLVIEDLQWIDSASEEVLSTIVHSEAKFQLLLLLTRRPDYKPPWVPNRSVRELYLEPLAADDICRLVQSRLAVDALPKTLSQQLTERADGNPLFAEEIVSYLSERGVLRVTAGTLDFDAGAAAQALPESIQSLLTERVDRLPPKGRALLQAASVIGRRFDQTLLEAAVGFTDEIDSLLADMRSLDLVQTDGAPRGHRFKHALVRDALYQSLLSEARESLHLKIADGIERQSDNQPTEFAEILAHHYSQTRNDQKAFAYLVMAGRKSLDLYSLDEAAAHFGTALDLLDRNPSCASDSQASDYILSYTRLLNMNLRLRTTIRLGERYLSRSSNVKYDQRSVIILHNYMFALLWNSRYREAVSVQKDILSLAQRLGDATSRAYALASEIHVATFDATMSLENFEALKRDTLRVVSETGDPYIQIWTRYVIGWEEIHRGRIAFARDAADDLVKVGEALNDPRATGLGLYLLGWIALIFGSYVEALDYSERSLAVALTPLERNGAINVRGCALILLGRIDEGTKILDQFRNRCIDDGDLYSLGSCNLFLALSKILNGSLGAGIRFIEEAIAREEKGGNRNVVDWYRGFLAEIYLEVIAANEKRSLSFLLRNLPILARIRFTASFRVQASMRMVLKNPRYHPDGLAVGRAYMILGLLHKIKNRRALSISHLTEARRILSQFGPSPMLARIDLALAAPR